MLQVDGGGGAVVLAHAADHVGVAGGGEIVGHRLGMEEVVALGLARGVRPEPGLGRGVDDHLGEGMRLGEPEPVVVAHARRTCRCARSARWWARCRARRASRPARENRAPAGAPPARRGRGCRRGSAAWPKCCITSTRSRCHGLLGVGRVIGRGGRLERTAVAAQVGTDHGEALGQLRRHGVPHGVRLRVAVQEQQRRTGAAAAQPDRAVLGADVLEREAGKEHGPDCGSGRAPESIRRSHLRGRPLRIRLGLLGRVLGEQLLELLGVASWRAPAASPCRCSACSPRTAGGGPAPGRCRPQSARRARAGRGRAAPRASGRARRGTSRGG